MQIFQKKTAFINIVEDIKNGIIDGTLLKPDGGKYCKASAGAYQALIYWLKKYEENRKKIFLKDIDLEWAEEFIIFLTQTKLSKNTISNLVATTKAVLQRQRDKGKCSFNSSLIHVDYELTTAVYNTEEELDKMLDLDLSQEQELQLFRDAYLIQCCTGLRFSDLKKIFSNIKYYIRKKEGELYIEIKTKKTEALVVIPVSCMAEEILARNNYHFKKKLDYKLYNPAIKTIAQRAGIDNQIIFSRTHGGERVDTLLPKYMFMTSHTARRSFATNAFLAGIPVLNIMQMTGHTTQASFFRYVRCSSMEAAIKVADHPFFNISLQKEIELLPNTQNFELIKPSINYQLDIKNIQLLYPKAS